MTFNLKILFITKNILNNILWFIINYLICFKELSFISIAKRKEKLKTKYSRDSSHIKTHMELFLLCEIKVYYAHFNKLKRYRTDEKKIPDQKTT